MCDKRVILQQQRQIQVGDFSQRVMLNEPHKEEKTEFYRFLTALEYVHSPTVAL